MVDAVHNYINELLALVALIVWLVRLEGRINAVEKRLDLVEGIYEKLADIAERLSYIEGVIRGERGE